MMIHQTCLVAGETVGRRLAASLSGAARSLDGPDKGSVPNDKASRAGGSPDGLTIDVPTAGALSGATETAAVTPTTGPITMSEQTHFQRGVRPRPCTRTLSAGGIETSVA